MASTPSFAALPLLDIAQISTANTNRDGTGALVLVASGTAAGKRISRAAVKATGTTTAGMVRFYLSLDSGATKRLVAELPVTAITASTSVATFGGYAPELAGLILPAATAQLLASTHNGEPFNIIVESGGL